MLGHLYAVKESGNHKVARNKPVLDSPKASLIPRRDMEADGFRRDIHANVMFAPWLDRTPGHHIRASEIIHLRFQVSRPIRGKDLKTGD
jgi:hypothetical protein